MRFLWIAAALLAAGCLASPAPAPTPAPVSPRDGLLRVLDALPPAPVVAADVVTEWENFLNAYPKRDYGTPFDAEAASYLRDELARNGFAANILTFPVSAAGGATPAEVRVVRGTLEGKDTAHRFAILAHYDTTQTTGQGAYDDGAGTIVALNVCKTLARSRALLNHTIDCLLFDGEEEGLLGSAAYTKWYTDHAADRGFSYDLAMGYDMTGINWPGYAAWKLYAFLGTTPAGLGELTPAHASFLNVTLHDHLDRLLPGAKDGVAVVAKNPRSSDEASFQRAHVPVVRWAGGEKAGDYPAYHTPLDTVPYVYQFAGGRAKFEAGVGAVLVASYATALGWDAFDPRAPPPF